MSAGDYISEYFTLGEAIASGTADRHGIDNLPPPDVLPVVKRTARALDNVRKYLGCPVLVSSWYRCPELNRRIGSKDTSQHVRGEAVDFKAPQFGPPRMIASFLKDSVIEYDQLILEFADSPTGGWVHVSFADPPRRQALIIDGSGTRSM